MLVSVVAEDLDGELGTFWTQEVLLLPKDLLLEPGVVPPEYTCRSDTQWSKLCVTYATVLSHRAEELLEFVPSPSGGRGG